MKNWEQNAMETVQLPTSKRTSSCKAVNKEGAVRTLEQSVYTIKISLSISNRIKIRQIKLIK